MAESPTDLEVFMLLCDSAQSVGGKLYILGGGWTQVSLSVYPGGIPVGIALRVAVPWSRANERFDLKVELVTDQGAPLNVNGENVAANTELELGRPPGLPPGTTLDANLALNFMGLPLQPGGYAWHAKINDEIKARAPFRVIP